jgi:hypothetical protein
MSKLRLDPESLRVKSFETDAASDRTRGTVNGHSHTTATDYFTTLCNPTKVEGQFPTAGYPIVPGEPIDPHEKYRLPDNEDQ